MLIRKINITIKDNLSISNVCQNTLYSYHNKQLNAVNLNTGSVQSVSMTIQSQMFSFRTDIIMVNTNTITVLTNSFCVLKLCSLDEPYVTATRLYYENNFYLLILTRSYIYLLNSDYQLTKIRLINKKNLKVKDIILFKESSLILTQCNRIYQSENFIKTGRIFISTEIFRAMYTEDVLLKMYATNKRIFFEYQNSFEIHKIINNLIVPICCIKRRDNAKIHIFKNNAYIYGHGLYELNDIPLKLCNEKINIMHDNYGICDDKIMVCNEEEYTFQGVRNLLTSDLDVDGKVKQLFDFVRFDTRKVRNSAINTKEDLIEFKKDVYGFNTKFDRIKMIYGEIRSIYDSFEGKIHELNVMQDTIEGRRIKILEKRENAIIRLKALNDIINSSKKCLDVETINAYKLRLLKCKHGMAKLYHTQKDEIIKKLKLQRMILRNNIK